MKPHFLLILQLSINSSCLKGPNKPKIQNNQNDLITLKYSNHSFSIPLLPPPIRLIGFTWLDDDRDIIIEDFVILGFIMLFIDCEVDH